MSWISRVFGDFDILEGTTQFEELEGEKLSTAESFTDAAGVEHTGELADIDDVGGGGGIDSWFDVTDYGAVGDGTTDDSSAIQSAVDAATQTDGMSVVYFPSPDSSYLLDGSTISLKPGVWFKGDGRSRITAANLGDTAMFDGGRTAYNDIWLTGLWIDGTGAWDGQPYSPTQKSIWLADDEVTAPENIMVHNCRLENPAATALGIDEATPARYTNNVVIGSGTDGETIGGNGIGIGVGEFEDDINCVIKNNLVIDTAEFAIILEEVGGTQPQRGFTIKDNVIVDAKYGIGVEVVESWSVENNTIRQTSDDGIRAEHIDATVAPKRGTIRGNDLYDIGGDGVSITATDAAEIFVSDQTFSSVTGQDRNIASGAAVVVNDLGREAAGAGNTPTEALWHPWAQGYDIHNTDDDTLWRLLSDTVWMDLTGTASEADTGGAAAITTVIDDFEDNDITEYTGATANFTTQTTTVSNGTYALESTSTSFSELISTSGLGTYPAQGDSFRYDAQVTNSGSNRFLFGVQDLDNHYYIELSSNADPDAFRLAVRSAGTPSVLTETNPANGFPSGEFVTVDVTWQADGSISATLYDANGSSMGSISATDATYTSGGIGWASDIQSGQVFDYLGIN